MTPTPELLIPAGATLAEGPHWDARTQLLYWVDIQEHRLHAFDPQTGEQQAFHIGQYVSAVVARASGGLLLAVQHGFAHFDRDSGQLHMLTLVEPAIADKRFNDGKCDPAGRFWAGTYSLSGKSNTGSVYCLDVDRQLRRMITHVTISNGMAWSRDQTTLYYIDTPTRTVAAFDYEISTAAIANRRIVINIPPDSGWPDGMTIDAEDKLWIAHWGGSYITRWDPARGTPLECIPLPAANVTSCCFGGPNFDQLYITTARHGLNKRELATQPAAGSIFRIRPEVGGLPAHVYAG
jgi:sugar lactone lactonase YvrE